jgi:SAM-dependent methyltransferase
LRLNDPELVRREYADESRFATRAAVWAGATGPDPRELAFEAVADVAPRRVLEVGCGRGEAAERILRELGAEVIALDQSERMVEMTRARGVDARQGDVQDVPFEDAIFDCALAAWMLYHVPDLGRAVAELARVLRPGGRLVAVTNTQLNLPELWSLLGERAERVHGFNAENGEEILRRHFASVTRRDARGTIRFPDRDAAFRYVKASTTRSHLAEDLPDWDGPLDCTRFSAVFAADKL